MDTIKNVARSIIGSEEPTFSKDNKTVQSAPGAKSGYDYDQILKDDLK
jgi:hypothetical protein